MQRRENEPARKAGAADGPSPVIFFLARLLDNILPIPGTKIRIGIDPILGLLPVFGDSISALCSAVIIYECARIGTPKRYLLLMLGNILIDAFIGAIPFLGDIFDFAFQANQRNIQLLNSIDPQSFVQPRNPRIIGWMAVAAACGLIFLTACLAFALLSALLRIFQ
jgi:hypothetical protein